MIPTLQLGGMGQPIKRPVVVGGGDFATEVMADAPWAWWQLDDADSATYTADASGNGRHLTTTLNPLAKRKKPPLIADGGYAQTFDGSAGCVNGGTLTAFSGHQALSMFCIIKVNAFTASAHLMHNGDTGVGSGQGQLLMLETNGALRFYSNASGGWRDYRSDPGAMALGETAIVGWAHDPVADTLKFFKNGSLIKTYAYTFGLSGGASAKWALGGLNGSLPGAYCDMDHAMVFAAALSEARALAHAQAAGLA